MTIQLISCKALTLEMLGVQILADALQLIYQLCGRQVIFPGVAGSKCSLQVAGSHFDKKIGNRRIYVCLPNKGWFARLPFLLVNGLRLSLQTPVMQEPSQPGPRHNKVNSLN